MSAQPRRRVLIHAVYLLNSATEDPDIREKTLASLIASLRVGRRARRARRRAAPRSRAEGRGRRRRSSARARSSREALARARTARCTSRTPPAPAARSGRTFDELAGCSTPPAAHAPRRLPGLLPPARLRLRRPHAEGLAAVARRARPRGRPGPAPLPAPQRLADAAGLQPRPPRRPSARARSARTAARCSCPSRLRRTCPACSRRPGPTVTARPRRRSPSRVVDWPGSAQAPLGRGLFGYTRGPRPSAPGPPVA